MFEKVGQGTRRLEPGKLSKLSGRIDERGPGPSAERWPEEILQLAEQEQPIIEKRGWA